VAYRVALAARAASVARIARERACAAVPAGEQPDEAAGRELRALLDEEVMGLPEKYRAVFVLCDVQGKTNEEAARQLGCPRGTVLSRLARARERLRTRLTRRGVAAPAVALTALGEGALASLSAEMASTTIHAVLGTAGQAAAAVSPRVAALTEGVLRVMFVAKLKSAAVGVLALLLGIGGLGAAVLASGQGATAPEGAKASGEAPGKPGPAEELKAIQARARSLNNLKQIGLALHNFHDTYKDFPAPAIYSKAGKPLLSWRVALLPFIEQAPLYQQFRLDEPWDSAHNRQLLKELPPIYAPPTGRSQVTGGTYYQAIVGKGAGFEPGRSLKITEFLDGTSNTILVVEAGDAVPWTKPEDLPYVPDQALPRTGGLFGGHFHALFADGFVRLIPKGVDGDLLRKAITRDAGEPIDTDKLSSPLVGREDAVDPALLKEENQRLRAVLDVAQKQAAQAREQIKALRARLNETRPAADSRTAKLIQEYADLQAAVERAADELKGLREEERRLRKALEDRKVKGR
jgi:hypothetical protein